MKKLNYFIFLLLFFFQTCESVSYTGFQFGEERTLTGKVISVMDSLYLRYPFRIRQNDSLLYMIDLHGRDYYCHTLTYPEMTLVASLAHKGNGPEEFLSVENIRLGNQGMIYLLDANKKAISIYSPLNDSICKQINLSDKLIRSLDFALINDSLFVIPDYTGKYRINIVDGDGIIKKQLFQIPTIKRIVPHVSDIVLAQAWRSFLDYNPDNGILAMATQLGQVIEIYNLKTDETVNIVYGTFGEPAFVDQGAYAIPDGIMGYSDVHVGKDKIYAIFWGTSFKEIRDKPFDRIEGGNIIQVFSLEGIPTTQYTLDRYITGFSIDEENNKFLGLDVNSEQQIVEYQLYH